MAIYDGLHFLDLDNIFRDVAWSTVYVSGTSILDPIVGSLSHFKRICHKLDIQLESIDFWNKFDNNWLSSGCDPYLFVVSGSSSEVEKILTFVENGSNLLVIPPPLQLGYKAGESFCDLHSHFLKSLDSHLGCHIKEDQEKELGKGRVFYIPNANQVNDLLIEPSPLGGFNESEKEEKERKIELLIQQVTTFNVPCVDCQVRSVPACWPQDQPLVIEIELTHRSFQRLDQLVVTVEMPSSFEPLSTTEIYLQDIRPNSKRSIAVLAIPRSKGIYKNPLSIYIKLQTEERHIFLPASQIEIIVNLPELLRSSRPTKIDLSSRLLKYETKLKPLATSSDIIELLNVDPDAVVTKVRRIGEHLCKSIARKYLPNYNNKWTFSVITKQLFDSSILNSKSKGYIDTIRIFGNMAAHTDDVDTVSFDHEDALSICYALVLFLKEVTEANLI